jgi:hypothetical protein
MLVAPVPFFNAEIGGFDGVHPGVEPQRLDHQWGGLGTHSETLRNASLHTFDELEEVVGPDEHFPMFSFSGMLSGGRAELFAVH